MGCFLLLTDGYRFHPIGAGDREAGVGVNPPPADAALPQWGRTQKFPSVGGEGRYGGVVRDCENKKRML